MRHWNRRLAAWLLTALAGVPAAYAAPFTYAEIDPNGPAKIWGKAAADMDGDGRTDLLVGGHAATRPGLFWYRNPDWQRQTISTTAAIGTDIDVADLDGDGDLDIVATTDTGKISGITLFAREAAAWTTRTLASGFKLHDIEVADIDLDGRADIVGRGQNAGGNLLHLWLQLAPGAFTYGSLALPAENGDGLKIADIDLDGRPDIVVPRYWLRNTAPGDVLIFTHITYNSVAPANGIVSVGPIDGDAALDIVVSPAHRAGTLGRLAWFKGPADPAAGAIWPETIVENNIECDHHFIGIGDFDRDGHNDIATAMTELTADPKIKIYLNVNGDGTFAPPEIVADASSHGMQVIDIDNDGYLSLLGADYNRTTRTPVKLWRQIPQAE